MTATNPNKISPEEWRTAAKVARRSIFGNSELADAWENVAKYSSAADLTTQLAKAIRAAWVDRLDWDELAHAALKFLTSTGRLIPAGGMPLTAEQVEDVRTAREELRGYRNFTGYGRSHVNRLIAAVDALFPATEPAEEVKPIGWYRTMTQKFATEHFGFPDVTGWFEHTHTASDGGTWGWGGDGDWELLVYPPAPAEPAEEETKAERDSEGIIRINGGRIVALSCDTREMVQRWFDIAKPGSKWQRDYAAALDLFDREAASSPVVPAPTETGPWQTWESVPDDVWFTSASAVGFLPAHRKRGSLVDWQFRDGSVGVYDVSRIGNGKLMARAPFVAAEEG